MDETTVAYSHVIFRASVGSYPLYEAWPGIHNFQPGAIWTLYVRFSYANSEDRRVYDIYDGSIDELTNWMAARGFPHREMR